MRFKGRLFSIGVIGFFNMLRYLYYHRYMGLPFKADFFVLTAILLMVGWWCGKQFDRANYYSEKDPLTNTYNRRTVESKFRKLALSCKKENNKLGIIMLDLNSFKEINDTYGHSAGDKLLIHVSNLLNRIGNKDDVIARWGGDEFVILIPNIKEEFQSKYIERLQNEFENNVEENLPMVGASVGFAIFPDQGESLQELIQGADDAMYKTKKPQFVNK